MRFSPGQPLPSPPRRVPTTLRLAQVLAGWTQLGCLVLLIGSLLFWGVAMNADITSESRLGKGAATAAGRVTAIHATGHTQGGKGKSKPIYAVHYRFTAADGVERESVSYTTGEKHKVDEAVTVEHLPDDPGYSRIRGARRALFPAGSVVVAIVPLAGVLIALYGVRRGQRAAWLLAEGESAGARLISKTDTGVRINKKPQYKLVFEFKASDGMTYQHVVKTADAARLEDDQAETLLYDPRNPARAAAFDALPAAPRLDDAGSFAAPSGAATLLRLLLPAAVVVANVLAAVNYAR